MSLREVVGGYDIARLPIAVPPAAGEHGASWLRRWSHRYGLSAGQLLARLGLPTSPIGLARTERFVADHFEELLLASGTGTDHTTSQDPDSDDPATTTTADLTSCVANYLRAYHRRRPAAANTMRYCPRCLADTGGVWPARWATPCELVCLRHQIVLLQVCPGCGQVPFHGQRWLSARTASTHCDSPHAWGHTRRRRHTVCGFDLRTAPNELTPFSGAGAAAQQRLHQLARAARTWPSPDGGLLAVCGVPTTAGEHLDAVLELLVEHLGRVAPLVTAAADPTPVLSALSAALSVLAQPDTMTAAAQAQRHGLLDPAGTVTPIGPETALTRRRRNPLLASIRLGSLTASLSPTAQIVFRTASSHPRYPTCSLPIHATRVRSSGVSATRAETPSGSVPLAFIPQQLWPGVLTPWVTDGDHLGRAAGAMMLAKVGSTRPWRLIAIDLGLPASFAAHPPALVRHLRHENTWPGFLQAIDTLAEQLLAAPPPIDYQTRRWRAADPQVLTAALDRAHAACCGAFPACGDPRREDYSCAYSQTPHAVTTAFWQAYTGGDPRLGHDQAASQPAITEPTGARAPMTRVEAGVSTCAPGLPDQRERGELPPPAGGDQTLFAVAAHFLETLHATGSYQDWDNSDGPLTLVEPLVWQPP